MSAKPSRSEFPSDSSAPSSPNERAKSLGLHESKITVAGDSSTPARLHSSTRKESRDEPPDSSNMLAARRLRMLREASGLTQEELAAIAGESRKQVQKRETGKVYLGPLRLLIVLERAAASRIKTVKR